jgi:hypothetical protein
MILHLLLGVRKLSNNIEVLVSNTKKVIDSFPPLEIKAKGRGRVYVDDSGTVYPSVTTVLNIINKPALIPWAKKQSLEKVRYVLQNHVMNGTLPQIKNTDDIEAIISEASKTPDQALQLAGDFGSQAHAMIDRIIKARINNEKDPKITPDLSVVMKSFEIFCETYKPVFVASEVMVCVNHDSIKTVTGYHMPVLRSGYAGTIDAIALVKSHYQNYYKQDSHTAIDIPVVIDFKTGKGIYDEHRLQVGAYSEALALRNISPNHNALGDFAFNEAWVVKLSKDRDDPTPSMERVRVAPARDAFLDALNLHTQIKEKLWMEQNIYKKE